MEDGNNLLKSLKPADALAKEINNTIRYKIGNEVCSADFYAVSSAQWLSPKYDMNKCSNFAIKSFVLTNNTLSYYFYSVQQGITYMYNTTGNLTAIDDDSAFTGMREEKWSWYSNNVTIYHPRKVSEYALIYS